MNMWRCDYCGQQQHRDSRKCVDCGGPRGEGDAGSMSFSSGTSRFNVRNPGKAFEEFEQDILEAQKTIGAAFNPIFERFAYPNEKLDISDRIL